MNDLEDRLRSTLDDRAGSLAPSPNPRAALAVRLARRERRRPVLAVAAAVIVTAAIAVPVVLTQRDHNPPVSTDEPYVAIPKWIELGEFVENGVAKRAWLSVDAHGKGFCIEEAPIGGEPKPYNCYGVTKWEGNTPSKRQEFVGHVTVLGPYGSQPGPLPNLVVFITSPKVAELTVSGGNDGPVVVREVARNAGAAYFVADFDGASPGRMSYIARDSKGREIG